MEQIFENSNIIESNIIKEDAYFRAFTLLDNDIETPRIVMRIFNNELYNMQLKYWKIHGFNISKMKNIKKIEDEIEYLKIDSISNITYNPRIYLYECILNEIYKLEQKDFNY